MIHARRNAEGLQQTFEQLVGDAPSGMHRMSLADLSEEAACQSLVDEAFAWRPRIDAWVHCAGADVLTGDARAMSLDEKLERLWNTDVLGTIRTTRLVGKRMVEQDAFPTGRLPVIVTIGWDQASQGMAGDAGQMFGPIKAAVAAFTLSLSRTLAPHVRVLCAAPGWIRTAWGDSTSDYWNQRAMRESLLGRWGTADDVAKAISFMVSDDASFLTGQVVPINGGFRHEYDSGT